MTSLITLVFIFFVAPVWAVIIILLVLRSRTINMHEQLTIIQRELKTRQALLNGIVKQPPDAAVKSHGEGKPKEFGTSLRPGRPADAQAEIRPPAAVKRPSPPPIVSEIDKTRVTPFSQTVEASHPIASAVIAPLPPLPNIYETEPQPAETNPAWNTNKPITTYNDQAENIKSMNSDPQAELREIQKQIEGPNPYELLPPMIEKQSSEPPSRPVEAEIKTEDSLLEKIGFFLIKEGRIWVISGLAVLFLGAVFGVRYTIGLGLLSPQARVVGTCAFGLALLLAGLRFRGKKADWAMAVQGGGLGIIYLAIVASFRLYTLTGQGSALFMMSLVVIVTALLALWQNSQTVAHLSIVAAFAAPILISNSDGNHVGLFSFYLVLNVGILFMSLVRPWRRLYITGFSLTFGIFAFWVIQNYRPDQLFSCFIFLTVFYLFYVFLGVKAAVDYDGPEKKLIRTDLTLSILAPLIYLSLTLSLYPGNQLMALTSTGVGALSLLLGLGPGNRPNLTNTIFKCQALIYLNMGLAIFIFDLNLKALDGKTILSLLWAMEGAMLYHHGLYNNKAENRLFGQISLFSAAVLSLSQVNNADQFLLAQFFLGSSLLYMAWSRLSREAATPTTSGSKPPKPGVVRPPRGIYLGPLCWLAGSAIKSFELCLAIDGIYAFKWLMFIWTFISLALWLLQRLAPAFSEVKSSGGYPVLNAFQKAPMIPALIMAFPAIVSVFGAARFICPLAFWDTILWAAFFIVQIITMLNGLDQESDKLYINLTAFLLPVVITAFICAGIVSQAGLSISQEHWWYSLNTKAGELTLGNLGLESAILVPFLLATGTLIFILKNEYLEDNEFFVPTGLIMFCIIFFRFVVLSSYVSQPIAFLPYLPIVNPVDLLQTAALTVGFIYLWVQFDPQPQTEKRPLFFSASAPAFSFC